MSDPRHAVVLAAFDAFRDAVSSRSAARAEALASHAGWRARGDGVGRFFRRAARLGHVPSPSDEVTVHDERASVRFVDAEGRERFALFARGEEQTWELLALPDSAVRSALHLSGELTALARLTDLASSERGAAWARTVVSARDHWRPEVWPTAAASVAAVDKLRVLIGEDGARVDRIGSWDLDGVGRVVVGLRVTRRRSDVIDEVWVVLSWDSDQSVLIVHHLVWTDELDDMVGDLPLAWDGSAVIVDAPVAETPSSAGLSPAELLAVFDQTRLAFLDAGGATVSEQTLLDAVRRHFAQRVHGGRGTAVGIPRPLDMSGAVRDYVARNTEGDVAIDRSFVKNHASGVLSAMIGAFAKALAPEAVGESEGRGVTVDVVDLVGSLLPADDD